jgi:hypothetical protein
MLAQPALIDRSMTNYWAGVSRKGNKLFQDGGQIKREKRTSITTARDLYLSFATFLTPLNFSLVTTFNVLAVVDGKL